MPTSRTGILPVLLIVFGLAAYAHTADPSGTSESKRAQADLADYYGFLPVELYKLEKRSGNLVAADLNDDRRTDLLLVDNGHSRLDLLAQLSDDENRSTPPGSKRVNFIGNDRRFRHDKITVDKVVAALDTGDFNSDGKADLVYFGGADQLVIRLQQESGTWQNKQRMRLPDVQVARWNTAAGDLNGDGKDDIAVLGKKKTYLIYQQADGRMAAPQSLMNTSSKLSMVQIADLDGDGRKDLCYLSSDDGERPLCARMQDASGRLGPEFRFELDNPRAWTLHDLDGRPGVEILTIESRTGRVKVHRIVRPQAAQGELAGRLIFYGFGSLGSGRKTDLAVGDLDGDGLADVLVTDPDGAQVIAFRQEAKHGLGQGRAFPSLTDIQQIRIGNLDGDSAQSEVVVLSTKEKAVGLCRMEGGRLSYPQVLTLADDPVAIELADLDRDGRHELICLCRDSDAGSSNYQLLAFSLNDSGEWNPRPFAAEKGNVVNLKLKSKPQRLMKLDANTDGRTDFLIFNGSEPVLLLTDANGVPVEHKNRRGLGLGKVTPGALFIGRSENPSLLVAQQNFARSMKVDTAGRWQVADQYNASESNAKISGAAEIDLDDQPGSEIVLVDSGVKKLRVLKLGEMLFQPWKEVEIGEFRHKATQTVDLNGDGRDDLLLFGVGRFGVLYAGRTDPQLEEVASYETKLEKTRFADLVAGDLNADGHADIACLDTQSQIVEILDFDLSAGLRHALYFKVFEAKSLTAADNVGVDPREALIEDVTGDGRNDLILLSHDRVLVYPQDSGE